MSTQLGKRVAARRRRWPKAGLSVGVAIVLVMVLAPWARAAGVAATPVAIGVKLTQDAAKAKLVFDLSAPVVADAFVLADPDRVIVDLPEVNFQLDPAVGRTLHALRGGLVSAFRFGLFAPGKSRIVIDLGAPVRIAKASAEKIASGQPSRLVIELAATDRASFHKAADLASRGEADRASQARKERAGAEPTAAATSRPVVVLDPGHGGIDAGATGIDKVQEKDIVFQFTQLLAAKLQASGRYTVVLTRNSDVFVSLDDRVQVARNAHAALFVSIHADTISSTTPVAGATVYTVSERASDAEAARIAESENRADLAGGIVPASPADAPQVNDILFDLTRRETRTYAHVFSRTLINYLKNVTNLNNNPARSAGFVVLKAPEIPSVLIELGYLSSRSDVKQLESQEWREKTTGSVLAAIDRFFASRGQGGAATAEPVAVKSRPQGNEIAAGALAAAGTPAGAPH
jgi:N-acetylmuramoyl-L-alanine amidase